MPFIEPEFTVNDSGSTAVNHNNDEWSAALAAYVSTGGIILLPKGVIYVTQINLTEAHRGLVIQGSGTETKLVKLSTGHLIVHETSNFSRADTVRPYTAPTDMITVPGDVADRRDSGRSVRRNLAVCKIAFTDANVRSGDDSWHL